MEYPIGIFCLTYNMFLSDALSTTSVVAYDGCHKIYLISSIHKKWFPEYRLVEGTIEERMDVVDTWWDASCPLRFIELVTTKETNSSESDLVFIEVIPQE